MFSKNCEECGQKMFRKKRSEASRPNWRFCSILCRSIANGKATKERPKKPIDGYKLCKNCSEPFPFRNSLKVRSNGRIGSINQKYCSHKCSISWRNKYENPGRFSKKGEESYGWKGEKAGYFALHTWIRKTYGKAHLYPCAMCGIEGNKVMRVWMNISGEYKRNRKDWQPACQKCNLRFDRERKIKNPDYVNRKYLASV